MPVAIGVIALVDVYVLGGALVDDDLNVVVAHETEEISAAHVTKKKALYNRMMKD